MLVTANANSTRLQHQGQPDGQLVLHPALCKGAQDVSVRNDQNIPWAFSLRTAGCLQEGRLVGLDLLNQGVEASADLGRGLARLTAVMPDVPLRIRVQAPLLSALPDLLGEQTLVEAVLPLPDVLGRLDLVLCAHRRPVLGREEQLESPLGASAWGDEDVGEIRRRDDLDGTDDGAGRGKHLGLSVCGQRNIGSTCVAARLCPFRLAWALSVKDSTVR
jgi:hypothetical protein